LVNRRIEIGLLLAVMAPSDLLEGRRLGVQAVAKMRRGLALESQDAPVEFVARATEVVQEKPHTLNSMAVPIALAVTYVGCYPER
jgi:hypothetical protein